MKKQKHRKRLSEANGRPEASLGQKMISHVTKNFSVLFRHLKIQEAKGKNFNYQPEF